MLRDDNNFLEKKDAFEQGMLALHFNRPLEAIKYLLLLEDDKNSAVYFNFFKQAKHLFFYFHLIIT